MIGPTHFSERGSSTSIYGSYESTSNLFERPAAATGLYVDREIHRPEMKTDTAGLCTRLILNGAFKCIKCSKVTAHNLTVYFVVTCSSVSNLFATFNLVACLKIPKILTKSLTISCAYVYCVC